MSKFFTWFSLRAQNGMISQNNQFIKRWPACPKIAVYGPSNTFIEEISTRMAVDLGVPILKPQQLINEAVHNFNTDRKYDHPFFKWIHDHKDDPEALLREKILIKLLILNQSYGEGFILNDFPNNVDQALMLEDYKGGLNAFVHISLPAEVLVEIEEAKIKCADCHKVYYKNNIIS